MEEVLRDTNVTKGKTPSDSQEFCLCPFIQEKVSATLSFLT